MSEQAHGMMPGSHERPFGPTCRCGAWWSRWQDKCLTEIEKSFEKRAEVTR